jgi:hypothetical protein
VPPLPPLFNRRVLLHASSGEWHAHKLNYKLRLMDPVAHTSDPDAQLDKAAQSMLLKVRQQTAIHTSTHQPPTTPGPMMQGSQPPRGGPPAAGAKAQRPAPYLPIHLRHNRLPDRHVNLNPLTRTSQHTPAHQEGCTRAPALLGQPHASSIWLAYTEKAAEAQWCTGQQSCCT